MIDSVGAYLAVSDWRTARGIEDVIATAKEATRLGMTVHFGEHARRETYFPSALAAAGVLVGAVPGIRIRTAAAIAAVREPLSVLRDADLLATVAAQRGGRFDLGVVAGYDAEDLPSERYTARFEILDELIAAAGDHQRSRSWGLFVGATTTQALPRVARAEGVLVGTMVAPEELDELIATYRDISDAGRAVVIRRWVDVSDAGELEHVRLGTDVRTPSEALVGGKPAQVAEQLRAVRTAGADEIVLGPVQTPDELARLASQVPEELLAPSR